jgi:hypothetical protein
MRNEGRFSVRAWRALAQTSIVALGLVTIVGSGGGLPCPGPCAGDFPPEPMVPTIEPAATTVQVGGTAVFSARNPGITSPGYQWWRGPRGGALAAIPGATGATYTFAGANLQDDGSVLMVNVTGAFDGRRVDLSSARSQLTVSSMPPVVFQDTEFLSADWSVAVFSQPQSGGPTHVEEQAVTGGNPGPFRKTAIVMPAGPSTLYVFDTFAAAAYDPALQGPLYVVDFAQDCLRLPGTLGAGPTLLLEQDGRHYVAGGPTLCEYATWGNMTLIPGHFVASDFVMVDGPACTAGQACPDFSAGGKAIRFGFANSNQGLAGYPGGSGGFGIDNWKVSAWRR